MSVSITEIHTTPWPAEMVAANLMGKQIVDVQTVQDPFTFETLLRITFESNDGIFYMEMPANSVRARGGK